MIHDLLANVAILVAFLLVIGQVFKKNSFNSRQDLKLQAVLGIAFGILGIILMLYSIKMDEYIIIDLRTIAIIFAGIMGGPIAAVMTAIIIALFRIAFYGISTVTATAFLIILLVGAGAGYISSTKLSRLKKCALMFMIAMLLSHAGLTYLTRNRDILLPMLAYYWLIHLLGAALAYFTCEYIISANSNYKLMSYYRMTADNLLDMISTLEPGGRIIFVSPSVTQLFGYTPEEFMGTTSYDYIHPDDIEPIRKAYSDMGNYRTSHTQTCRMRRKDGKYIWVETSVKGIFNDEGTLKEMVCVTRDIAERKKIEQELRVSSARLKAIFDNAGTGIVLRDVDGNLIDANQAYLNMVGYAKEEVNQISNLIHEDDHEKVYKVLDDLVTGKSSSDKSDICFLNKDGRKMYAEVTSTFIPGTEYTPASIIRVVNDITERKRKEEELIKAKSDADRLAATDFLTGIMNRRAFSEKFDSDYRRAAREKTPICLILTDIDHFKEINDVHGHQIGDHVLQKFTKCLSGMCRSYDYIGRLGGEEFIICLPNTGIEQGKNIAERMRKAVEDLNIRLLYLKEPIRITASFGVSACIPQEKENAEEIIVHADNAMYKAKEEGRNRVRTI